MNNPQNYENTYNPTKATVWKRYDQEEKKFKHNHLELGWALVDKPVGKFDHQTSSWRKGLWMKEHVMLVGKDRKVERLLINDKGD